MADRKIAESIVRECLIRPDKILQSKSIGEKKVSKKLNGKVLVLIFKELDPDISFVITAFETSDMKRYL